MEMFRYVIADLIRVQKMKAIDEKRKHFEKLWVAGGGHFNYFIYSAPIGQYVRTGTIGKHSDDDVNNALQVLNIAYVFYLGGWEQCNKNESF